jgi:hypothetical protein
MEVTPTIDKNELAKLFGSDEFRNVSRATCMKIEKLETVFEKLIDPSLHHQNLEIDSVKKGSVLVEEGPEFKSPKLSKTLQDCEEVICYIATLGDGIEGEIQRLMNENRLAEAYILDAMASVAADNMVKMFHQRMKDNYENQGKQVTLCFSPGYCDWPVTEQKKLFNLFDSDELDVELTDSCFMQPRKSISGVFGITPQNSDPINNPYNPCLECKREDCSARRN